MTGESFRWRGLKRPHAPLPDGRVELARNDRVSLWVAETVCERIKHAAWERGVSMRHVADEILGG